ncbi:MAG: M56 family metallopeptidase [Bacillota bacterium]|jgi:bla regulator protein BlaR1
MGNLFSNLLAMSAAGSAVVGLTLLLRPVTAKIFPAKWQYGIGKIAFAFFLVPVSLIIGKISSALTQAITPSHSSGTSSMTIPEALRPNNFVDAMDILMEKHLPTTMEKHLSLEVMGTVLFIWLVGAIVFAGWHFYCYHKFIKQLRADSFPVADNTAAGLLSSCKASLGIHGEVKLMLNHKITSPMLVGLHRPIILLPTSKMQEIDLKLVLTHELIHLKRNDLWVKLFALVAGTIHWYNPFVHVLRKDVGTWGELSCDEVMVSNMSHEEKKLYGIAILNTLDIHSGINTAFCSSLCENKKHIERRLTMLLNVKKTKKHIAILAIVVIVAMAVIGTTVSAIAASFSKSEKPDSITNSVLPIGSIVNDVSGDLSRPVVIDSDPGTLVSVKLSDENKFTPEEWQVILKKLESGEIKLEAENTVSPKINASYELTDLNTDSDGQQYSFSQLKDWVTSLRINAEYLVLENQLTRSQSDALISLYETLIAELEGNDGMEAYRKTGDDLVEEFYSIDQLTFELPTMESVLNSSSRNTPGYTIVIPTK